MANLKTRSSGNFKISVVNGRGGNYEVKLAREGSATRRVTVWATQNKASAYNVCDYLATVKPYLLSGMMADHRKAEVKDE